MAGQEIYLGKMIESLQTDIATVVSTLNQHTTELGNINLAVAQGINSLNVKPGTRIFNIANTEKSGSGTNPVAVIGFTAFCTGKLGIRLKIKSNQSIGTAQAYYRENGGTWILIGSKNGSSYQELTGIIPVTVTSAFIELGIKDSAQSYVGYIDANVTLEYELVDIVNDGPFGV
jgi:hypothetical protein